MDKNRMNEIKERLLFLMGSPSQPPHAETAEDWAEVENLMRELEQMKQDIAKIITPEKYSIAVSKLSKCAVELINNEGGEIQTSKKKNICVRLSVGFNDALLLPANYTKYHDAIQMTIGSLKDSGAKCFTAEQVYRAMNGLTTHDYVTPQAVAAVTKAIRQLNNLWVTIDRSEEVKAFPRLKDVVSVISQKRIIPYNEIMTITNKAGREVTAYILDKLPPIYEYSKDKGQIRSLPQSLFNIKGLNSSAENTAIKIWLLQQIESMKPSQNGTCRDRTINFDTLFRDLRYDIILTESNPRAHRARYIKQIFKMLDYWTNCGYISGYTVERGIGRGNPIKSVTISLPDKKESPQ